MKKESTLTVYKNNKDQRFYLQLPDSCKTYLKPKDKLLARSIQNQVTIYFKPIKHLQVDSDFKKDHSKGILTVFGDSNGDHVYVKLPNTWKQIGLRDKDQLPANISNKQVAVDFRSIIGRAINNCFKGPAISEAQMDKMVHKWLQE